MTDDNSISGISNPHDKLFREIWSNRENALGFLKHYLPESVLNLIDFETLEISKDSFVEKDLSDYYSDILYRVTLKDNPGFVYVLFEHKSYYDRYVHLQLLEYMLKIWRLSIKQKKNKKSVGLPIVIPLLICHGKRGWPENSSRLSGLFNGPVNELSDFIPDFKFDLHDLTGLADEDIKGTIMARVVMLLFKYIFEPDLMEKLPDILSLMKDLMAKQTGLQYLETIFRYLSGTVDGITTEEFRQSIQLALSKKEGDYIMTLAERLKEEGRIEGEIKGRREGLKDAVELGITFKFPNHVDDVMNQINEIDDLEVLMQIKETLKIAEDISQILACIKE